MFSVKGRRKVTPAKRKEPVRELSRVSSVGKNEKMIVGTGSSIEGVLMPSTEEGNMYNTRPSTLKCRAANGDLLKVGLEGLIDLKCPGHNGEA